MTHGNPIYRPVVGILFIVNIHLKIRDAKQAREGIYQAMANRTHGTYSEATTRPINTAPSVLSRVGWGARSWGEAGEDDILARKEQTDERGRGEKRFQKCDNK